MTNTIDKKIIENRVPILGICYGMHDTSTVRKGIRINSAGGTNWGTGSKYYLYGMKP